MHEEYCLDCIVLVFSFSYYPELVGSMARPWLIGLEILSTRSCICHLMRPGMIG